ncbi:hypothetical protein M1446_04070 [Candidatus Dependentiae bacterium]|nr:hypothetical protein [Candidatus Dependentiae bacterium]
MKFIKLLSIMLLSIFSCNSVSFDLPESMKLALNSMVLGYSVDSLEEQAINIEKRSKTLKDKFIDATLGTINLFNAGSATYHIGKEIGHENEIVPIIFKSAFSLVGARWAVKLRRTLPTCKWEKKCMPLILFLIYNLPNFYKYLPHDTKTAAAYASMPTAHTATSTAPYVLRP